MAEIDEIDKEIEAKKKEWNKWNKKLEKAEAGDKPDIRSFKNELKKQIGRLEARRNELLKEAKAEPAKKVEQAEAEIITAEGEELKKLLAALGRKSTSKIIPELTKLTKNFFVTRAGHELRSLEDAVADIKEMHLANFLHHFVVRKGAEKGDFVDWIETSLKDKPLSDKIHAAERRLWEKVGKWKEQWEKAGGRAEEFVKNPAVAELAEKVKAQVVVAIEKRINQIKKFKKDKTTELTKAEKKVEDTAVKIAVETEGLEERWKELEKLTDDVARNEEAEAALVKFIKDSSKYLDEHLDPEKLRKQGKPVDLEEIHKKRVELENRINHALDELGEASENIIRLSEKGAPQAEALAKDVEAHKNKTEKVLRQETGKKPETVEETAEEAA